MLGIGEAGLDIAQRREGADHEQRADQKNEGHGDLRHDQDIARTLAGAAGAGGAIGAGERGCGLGVRVLECRDGAEKQSGENGKKRG